MMDNLATQASWLQIPFYMMAYDFAMVNVGNVIEKTNSWEDSERGIFFNPQHVKTGFVCLTSHEDELQFELIHSS